MNKSKKIVISIAVVAVVVIGVFALSRGDNGTNENAHTNYLMTEELQEAPVMNGFGDEEIGTYAYIKINSGYFNMLTPDDYLEFAKANVKDGGYLYVTIISSDGNGARWAAGVIDFLSFGKVDAEGQLKEQTAQWQLVNDKYEDITEQWKAEQAELQEK